MSKLDKSVSIVIPVYNEQDHLVACLKAIAEQSVKPLEVIVVDNNSTDETAAIAQSFPFVKLLKERRQGVVFARDRGFNVACGEIIGRIDADTLLPPNWIGTVQRIFEDESLAATSGSLHYYDVAASKLIDRIDLACRNWLTPRQHEYVYLLASNMAIRCSAWQLVKEHVCHERNLHEDQDLAIHLGKLDKRVSFDARLRASVSGRRIDSPLPDLWRYSYSNVFTYKRHDLSEGRPMYAIIALVFGFYVPLRIMYAGFDNEQKRFRFHRLFGSHEPARVNPVTFVAPAEGRLSP